MDAVIRIAGWGNIWNAVRLTTHRHDRDGRWDDDGVMRCSARDLDEIQRSHTTTSRQCCAEFEARVERLPGQATERGLRRSRHRPREGQRAYGSPSADVTKSWRSRSAASGDADRRGAAKRIPCRVRLLARRAQWTRSRLRPRARRCRTRDVPGASRRWAGWDGGTAGGVAAPRLHCRSPRSTRRVVEGPSMIKSENGMLRTPLQLQRARPPAKSSDSSRGAGAVDDSEMPAGMHSSGGGTVRHQVAARRAHALRFVFHCGRAAVFVISTSPYHDSRTPRA